jgi:hypothetical protein
MWRDATTLAPARLHGRPIEHVRALLHGVFRSSQRRAIAIVALGLTLGSGAFTTWAAYGGQAERLAPPLHAPDLHSAPPPPLPPPPRYWADGHARYMFGRGVSCY